jgi:hypothetical protein
MARVQYRGYPGVPANDLDFLSSFLLLQGLFDLAFCESGCFHGLIKVKIFPFLNSPNFRRGYIFLCLKRLFRGPKIHFDATIVIIVKFVTLTRIEVDKTTFIYMQILKRLKYQYLKE